MTGDSLQPASDPQEADLRPAPSLAVQGLRKSFGRVPVLRGLDFEIAPGEFVGLIGPNGAGKSTLIKILDGVYQADDGEIRLGGQRVRNLSAHPDVAFVHQDLGLVEDMTIAENLRLGESPLRLVGPILSTRREVEAADAALARVGLTIPAKTLVRQLSPGEKTHVAIARAFDRGARLIVVDEATSTLTASDSAQLIGTLADLVSGGATVVMVSHKLSEIFDAVDRVILLRDGEIGADARAPAIDREGLAALMMGNVSVGDADAMPQEPGRELIRLEAVYGGRAGPIDLTLHAGEIVGLTGLLGSGLHDVAHLVVGSLRPTRGRVIVDDPIRRALVPEHRETQGGFWDLSSLENLTISALGRWRRTGLLRPRSEREAGAELLKQLNVVPSEPDATFGGLSGGNKQKVIFGRLLLTQPEVCVLCEPTRGVDVGARAEIHRLIKDLAAQGAAVLVASSDVEDLFAVCSRIAVVDGSLGEFADIQDIDDVGAVAAKLEVFV